MRPPSAPYFASLDPGQTDDKEDGFADSIGRPEVSTRERVGAPSTAFLSRPFTALFGAARGLLASLVGATLISMTASMVPAFSMGVLIDTAFANRAPTQLWIVICILVAAHLVEALATRWCSRASAALRDDRVRTVTAALVAQVEAAPLMALEAHTPATILGRLRSMPRIVTFYIHWYVLVISRPLFFLGAMAWLLAENLILGTAILVMTVAYVRLYWRASQKLRAQFMRETQHSETRTQALHEFAQGLLTLRIAGLIGTFYRALETRLEPVVGHDAAATSNEPWLIQLTRSYSSAGFIVVLALGASLVIAGSLSVGKLVIVNVVFRRILAETRIVVARVRRYYRTRTATETVGRFIDELQKAPTVDSPGGMLPDFERIVLRQVAVWRPGAQQPALSDVNLDIRRGEFVALVGVSGGGKTTLLKTIAGLYRPNIGAREHVGGNGKLLRFAYVSGTDTLFDSSVHQNIALHGALSRETVVEAACLALADGFVARLAQGYDTRLRNFGAGLSQGQKVRLAIARCLATDAPVMLMDEPTGTLDPAGERRFLEQLGSLRPGRTIVMATHRAAPALEADYVVVIAGGRVVETGKPADLLANPGSAFAAWLSASAQHAKSKPLSPPVAPAGSQAFG